MLKLLRNRQHQAAVAVRSQDQGGLREWSSPIIVLLLVLIAPQGVAFEQQPPLRVDIAMFEYPPLYHTSKSGKISGLIGETLKQICAEAALDCRFQMRPVSRAYMELERGEVQALVTVNFERFDACCLESRWQYPWRSGLYSKRPTSKVPTHIDGFAGEGLIVVQGWQSPYSYFDDLEGAERRGDVQVHRANSSLAALRMLDRDRAGYLWGGEEFQWFIQQMALEGLHFKPLLHKLMVLWVSKESPEIAKRFDLGYQRLKEKGWLDSNNILVEPLMTERYEEP